MIKIETEKLPIFVWSKEEDLEGFDNAIQQAKNLANHPLARKHVALMPDYHLGYGMPIGGVFATRGGVVPNAVGVDIGCGMIAIKTTLLAQGLTRDALQKIREAIHKVVPVGFSVQSEPQDSTPLGIMNDGTPLQRLAKDAPVQFGTLGGGNHFIEIQKDEEGYVWVMVHSGSRGVGKKVCDYYDDIAVKYMQMFHVQLPPSEGKKPELAFLPEGVPEYKEYLNAMQWCCDFAEESRERMLNQTLQAMQDTLNTIFLTYKESLVHTHHNYAAMENHMGENLLVHRKGAVHAKGKVIIPGSMGTASYIAEGLENTLSFRTCSHGAGRVMGRKQANRTITAERARESMAHVVFGIRDGDYEEMPDAYKQIDTVMANQSDLVTPLHRLIPLAVVKG